MNRLLVGAAIAALLSATAASAQPGPEHPGGDHPGWAADRGGAHHWRRGERMGYNDWNGAQAVDYRQHHLRQPPPGYEWRQANGQYILAAVATGVIASIILSGGR